LTPKRLAGRILGSGRCRALGEKASALIAEKDAALAADRLAKGQFDLEQILPIQLGQMSRARRMAGS